MIKLLLQPYLLACYCFTKAIEEKSNREKNINAFIAHIFTTPIEFLFYGIYLSFIGLYTKGVDENLITWGGGAIIFLVFGYWFFGWTERTIDRWKIPEQWTTLKKWERALYSIFGFIVFWGGFALFFYVTVKTLSGYAFR